LHRKRNSICDLAMSQSATSRLEQMQQNVPPKAQVKLLDDLVGACEHRSRHVEAERLGGLQVNN